MYLYRKCDLSELLLNIQYASVLVSTLIVSGPTRQRNNTEMRERKCMEVKAEAFAVQRWGRLTVVEVIRGRGREVVTEGYHADAPQSVVGKSKSVSQAVRAAC